MRGDVPNPGPQVSGNRRSADTPTPEHPALPVVWPRVSGWRGVRRIGAPAAPRPLRRPHGLGRAASCSYRRGEALAAVGAGRWRGLSSGLGW
jgi:hypothetical protein